MSTTALKPVYTSVNPLLIIERFLRDREGVWRQIRLEQQLNELIYHMLISSATALACYGAVMGSSKGLLQALAAAVKLPLLFLLTLAICLPTLYLFNLLSGGKLSPQQALALVLAAITVTASLSVAFAPISIFFMITVQSYSFFVVFNTLVLSLTGAVGLQFLVSGVECINVQSLDEAAELVPQSGRPVQNVNMTLLWGWLVLYALVGTQLGWTLRPFIGDPDMPFILFRSIEGNFYGGLVEYMLRMVR